MSDKKVLVIFGATGTQGGSVIRSILGDPQAAAEFSLRAVTRDVAKPAAQNLISQGIEVVSGDLNDKVSILAALKGACAVYLVTDFWATFSKETEITQGKNVADAAKECNIQHLIFSSLLSATELSHGSLTHVHHFDSKAIVETYIRSLGIPATFLMPGCYMDTIPGQTFSLDSATGSWKLALPMASTTRLPLFAAEFDTGKFVKAILLNREALLGKRIYAATAYATLDEIVDTFKESFPEAGKTATFEELKSEEYKSMLAQYGVPETMTVDLSEMMKFFDQFGYFGGASLEESLAILDEPLTTWKDYSENAAAFKGLN